MKLSRFNRFLLLTLCAATSSGNAAILTWDSDATFANGSTDGSGTWDTSIANWNDGAADIAWPNLVADTAVFGAGGTPDTVTVSGTVNVGRLTFNTPGSGAYTLSGGTLDGLTAISNLNTNGSITTLSSDITRTGNLSVYGGGATCNLTFSGTVNLGGAGNLTFPARNSTDTANANNTNGTIRLPGATSNTMGLNITSTKTGSQGFPSTVTVVLAKTDGAQAVSGNVSIGVGNGISRGIVQLGGSEQIADTATVGLGNSAYGGNTRFQLLNNSETIAGLNSSSNAFPGTGGGTTAVENGSASAGTSTLTIAGSGTYTYGTNGGSSVVLRDGSTGKLALTMNGAGTQIVTIGATYTGATNVTAGTLSIRSTFSSSATTVNGGTLNFQTATVGAAISGSSGQVTVTGTTNTNFSGGNKTYSVDTVLSGTSPTLTQSAANSLSASSLHNIGSGATLRTGNFAGSVKALTGVTGSVVDLNGTSANLTIADGAGQDFGGAIGGTGGLTKSGTGTQTLSGNNTFTGNTTVNGGTLVLSSSGSLTFKPTTNGTSNKVTGAGSATLNGTLVLDLTSANLTSGNTWTLVDVTTRAYGLVGISSPGLTFNHSSGVWTATSGSDVWTFTQSSGVLTHTITAGYTSWALSEGLDGTPGKENGALDDPNHNGIDNVVEYVLNGEPLLGESPATILPTLDSTGSNFVFTFTRRVESATDTTQIFEHGTNLSGWTPLNITAPTDGAVTLGTPTGGSPNLQSVTVTVAKGANTEMFGRLKVSKP